MGRMDPVWGGGMDPVWGSVGKQMELLDYVQPIKNK